MRPYALLALLLVAGCQSRESKQEEIKAASLSNPDVPPPTGPFCSVQPYQDEGAYSQVISWPHEEPVFIPNFDLSKGDTLNLVYKCSYCPEWISVPPNPSPAGMSYSVEQSTVTLYFQHQGDWVWALSASLNVCS